jgi:hypothetical protein
MIVARKSTPLTVTITFRNDNPNTIWNRLAQKLGRQPTHTEARAEVRRVLEMAGVAK